jgi:hypothetical protein
MQLVRENGYQEIPITRHYDAIRSMKANPDHLFHKEKGTKTYIDIDVCGTAARAKVEWEFPDLIFQNTIVY